jgi:hypothetical protein
MKLEYIHLTSKSRYKKTGIKSLLDALNRYTSNQCTHHDYRVFRSHSKAHTLTII